MEVNPAPGASTSRGFLTRAALAALVCLGVPASAVAGQAGPGAPAAGGNVRVTAVDGTRRTGEFVSLTKTDVVIKQAGREIVFPLATVAAVDRVGRAKLWGALIGGAAGAVYGYGVFEEDIYDPHFELKGALIVGSLGAAGGFGLGALLDRSHRTRHTLYRRPGTTTTVGVVPIATRTARGVVVTLRW
jgi:hypothetical protein